MRVSFHGMILSLALLIPLLSGAAWAQQPPSGVTLSGVVHDPSGAILAGVVVSLQPAPAAPRSATHSGATPPANPSAARQTITGAQGEYAFANVAPGPYVLRVAIPGFLPARKRVAVTRQPLTGVTLTLRLAAANQQVTVRANAATVNTSPADTAAAVTLNQNSLQKLPVFDQNYVATLSRFLNTGDEQGGAATLVVDGIQVSELPVSASAIQSIKIDNNPYSAQFQYPGRGRIEIITKPGQPHYHGQLNITYRNSALNARNAFATTRPLERRDIFEGNLTGPIATSKVNTFLFSGHHESRQTQSIIFAQTPGGTVNETVATPESNSLASIKLDHHATMGNEISVTYSFHRWRQPVGGVGGFTLASAASSSLWQRQQIWYHQRTLFGPDLLNQFQFRIEKEHSADTSLSSAPAVVVQGAFSGGGAQVNDRQYQYRLAGSEGMSWTRGWQTIEFGVNVPDWTNRVYDNSDNFGGTFFFDNLQDYSASRPYLFTQQAGNGHVEMLDKRIGSYIQDEMQLDPNLTFTAGLRYDWQNHFRDHHNFAPRVALAYALGSNRKTVLRAGAGIFYSNFDHGHVFDEMLYNLQGTGLHNVQIQNPGYPDPLAGGLSPTTQPGNVNIVSPNISTAETVQFSGAVERQLGGASLAVTYTGSRRYHQFQSRDLNAPLAPDYTVRPDPNIAQLIELTSAGMGVRNSLRISLRGQITPKLSGMTQYVYGRSWNNTAGSDSFAPDPSDELSPWGRSNWDRRSRFDFAGTYSAPYKVNLGLMLEFDSGQPYSETVGTDVYGDGMTNALPPGVGRNSLQGPGYGDVDVNLSREFSLRGMVPLSHDAAPTLRLSIAAFNVLNQVNFNNPVGNLQSPFFGQYVSADSPRQIQLAMRVAF